MNLASTVSTLGATGYLGTVLIHKPASRSLHTWKVRRRRKELNYIFLVLPGEL
jgi:hypothetical protein